MWNVTTIALPEAELATTLSFLVRSVHSRLRCIEAATLRSDQLQAADVRWRRRVTWAAPATRLREIWSPSYHLMLFAESGALVM